MPSNNYIDSLSNNAATAAASKVTSKKSNDELGKDAFLQLLVAQLQNQDPLNPAEDKEFIAQLSTFSTLEQMQNMNKSMEASQAASLIGKQVTWTESGKTYYGEVSGVKIDKGITYVVIGDIASGKTRELKLSDVQLIEESENAKTDPAQAATLIGKQITWAVNDKLYYGTVTSVIFSDGIAYAVVKDGDGKDLNIPMSAIKRVEEVTKEADR